jgi:hypothetical protein
MNVSFAFNARSDAYRTCCSRSREISLPSFYYFTVGGKRNLDDNIIAHNLLIIKLTNVFQSVCWKKVSHWPPGETPSIGKSSF